ncbi:MAG: NAD(P)/FAD-dependent oxidoreductase [Lachnospiraceae bacterium]|nr:NAD(P)/FAD-dependent oxidoreductase [Lachnospiraceae bacterium]
MPYDVAILGAGPAGLSAALTLKLHNKSILWFGSRDLSLKVERSERIANYPGVAMTSGTDLNRLFQEQLDEMDLELTDRMVTLITPTGKSFMLLADNEIFEAKTVILCSGTAQAKGFPGEAEFLGRGVSYCATCDGFLYKGKTIAVFCGAKRYEHEVADLAGFASEVHLFTPYADSEVDLPNVRRLSSPIKAVNGGMWVESLTLADGSTLPVDGIFILRSAIAPTTLIQGLQMDGPHVLVNRRQETNIPGFYAAGDITGRPYQITKAVGEGNVAAHSVMEYLTEQEKA